MKAHVPVSTCRDCPVRHEPSVELVTRHLLRDSLLVQVQVLDARTNTEFLGEDLRSNSRGGHLPGAKSLPHAGLLESDSTLQSPDDLRMRMRMRLREADVHLDNPVVTHCDAGRRGGGGGPSLCIRVPPQLFRLGRRRACEVSLE